ncbi:hypothetical protein IGI04_037325 [Brassica rapa subsp. trilocularis]|uniref:non-specific serine/threonine protein kinase n=1 Tax=Brassica rapa subsp. trilocularis TaxID=1813537 RepID=A0ABQ7LJP0_BRACM|nr:hypothetical protein IGI04_037325 [Brassica rapa subsp. trilocularis]
MVEVYISFDRCEDKVRYSFISHLSAAFHRRGISSFVGGSDPKSDGLSKGDMEKSKACVVVFSEKYSSSKPCLEELVKVSERRGYEGGHAVVPVFYRATKSSVKKQIWKSSDLTSEWRSALLEMVDLPGHESSVTQSESDLVEEIVADVREKLNTTENIGVYPKLLRIENLLQPCGVCRIGLWGMAGIGKTTLAEAIFDQMSGGYEASCFIKDFNKKFHEKGLHCLLEEHFGKTLREEFGVNSLITRPVLLRNVLGQKRDIKHENLQKLLPKVIEYADGNPLALKYYGRKTRDDPKEELEMLKRIKLCHSRKLVDIQELENARNIEVIDLQGCTRLEKFIDTGHFHHLRVINLSGCINIKVFPKVPPKIEELYLKQTAIRSIPTVALSSQDNSFSYDHEGHKFLDLEDSSESIMVYLEQLKVLDLSRCIELEGIQVIPKNLKKLYLGGTSIQELPSLVHLSELVVLDLENCKQLQKIPLRLSTLTSLAVLNLSGCSELEDIEDLNLPRNLEELYVAGTAIQEVPLSITYLSELVILDFQNCKRLRRLPMEISNLKSLVTLKLPRLFTVETGMSNLISAFNENVCQRQDYLPQPRLLPSSRLLHGLVPRFYALVSLSLCNASLIHIPEEICSLPIVMVLDLSRNGFRKIPESIKQLSKLHSLRLRHCRNLMSLPELPQSLKLLNVHGCVSLESVSWASEQFPSHYTFNNCFNKSPEVARKRVAKGLAKVASIGKEHEQELIKALAFSICAPADADQTSSYNLRTGSFAVLELTSSLRNTLLGFAIFVVVTFMDDSHNNDGLGVRCISTWKSKRKVISKMEKVFRCWAPREAPEVQKDHMFVFYEDAETHRSGGGGEGNETNVLADQVEFEFQAVNGRNKVLGGSCMVSECDVCVITAATGAASLSVISASKDMSLSKKHSPKLSSLLGKLRFRRTGRFVDREETMTSTEGGIRSLLSLLLLLLLSITTLISAADYTPTDKILLNCGGSSDLTDTDNRTWIPDVKSKFLSSSGDSKTSPAATQDPSVPTVPYMSARIFRSPFTYSFPVASGRKFVRLYFYPNSYDGLNATNSLFSLSSGPYTLLKNFSAAQTSQALNYAYIIKEFVVNVEGGTLNITFTPESTPSNAYAFVNGIEVTSMPDIYSSTDGTLTVVGTSSGVTIDNTTALENVYRLNVGGNDISPSADTGLFRSWYDDQDYIFAASLGIPETADPNMTIQYPTGTPSYIAPADVYSTARSMGPTPQVNLNYNLTWVFSVDSGFSYLVRLHFCEVSSNINKINQRVFTIYLNNQTAEPAADVAGWTGGNGIALHKDYVVIPPEGKGQQDLWLALHPNPIDKPQYYDSILNGVEIFKMNSSDGNLAGPNPLPGPKVTADPSKVLQQRTSHTKSHTAVVAGAASGAVVLGLLVGFFAVAAYRRRKSGEYQPASDATSGWLPLSLYGNSHSAGSGKTNTTGSYASSLPSNLCRHFSFAEIKAATKNFDESRVLGVGGFGKVYRGEIDGGTTKVAIKRGNPMSEQGVHEFQTEIEMLSKLRHRHLVSLIGYCEENCEMILVYDYMAHGTMREHLYKTQNAPLSWKQRLEICIGAARGLHYLHTGAKHTIIHRDVKTTNILLDEKWVAKVSDFGLSKTGPTLDHTHVSTVVKGSFGYLDPEYFRRQQLTDKSDVYSFGVVLFEALCARPALNPTLAKEQVSLAEWAPYCYKKGMLDQIVDPHLKGKITPECFKKFAETAMKCVLDQGIERPSMGDVLWNLEFALQLQESAEESGKGICGEMDLDEIKYDDDNCKGKNNDKGSDVYEGNVTDSRSSGIDMSIGGRSLASDDSDGLTPSAVFSQIMNPKGR